MEWFRIINAQQAKLINNFHFWEKKNPTIEHKMCVFDSDDRANSHFCNFVHVPKKNIKTKI
jgi:hypothetical protein